MDHAEEIIKQLLQELLKRLIKWLIGLVLPNLAIILVIVVIMSTLLLFISVSIGGKSDTKLDQETVSRYQNTATSSLNNAAYNRMVVQLNGSAIKETGALNKEELEGIQETGINFPWSLLASVDKLYNNFNPPTDAEDAPMIMPIVGSWKVINDKTVTHVVVHTKNGDEIHDVTTYSNERTVPLEATLYNGVETFEWDVQHTQGVDANGTSYDQYNTTLTNTSLTSDYSRLDALLKKRHLSTDENLVLVVAHQLDSSFYDDRLLTLLPDFNLADGSGDSSSTPPAGGGTPLPPADIQKAIDQALTITNTPKSWEPGMERLVMHESTGNPHAVNSQAIWYSQKWGYQRAEGLCQMMPPTFQEYKLPGHDDIWNSVDNTIASIRYIEATKGNVYHIVGIVGGKYGGY